MQKKYFNQSLILFELYADSIYLQKTVKTDHGLLDKNDNFPFVKFMQKLNYSVLNGKQILKQFLDPQNTSLKNRKPVMYDRGLII